MSLHRGRWVAICPKLGQKWGKCQRTTERHLWIIFTCLRTNRTFEHEQPGAGLPGGRGL